MTNPRHKLDFAGLDLTGRTRYGDGADWWRYEALSENPDTGNPEPVTSEQASALFDGSVVELDQWGNRTQSWPLRIVAENSRGLANGERELASLMGDTPRVLGYEPPDGWGVRTNFDAMVSSLSHQFDDMGELNPRHIGRHYILNLICAPFGYADYEVTDVLSFDTPGETPATLTISDGTSATNWSGVAVDAGELKMTNLVGADGWGGGTWEAQWLAPAPIDPSAYGYLTHTIRTASTATDPVQVIGYYDDDTVAFMGPIEVTPTSGDPALKTYLYQLAPMPVTATGLARMDFSVKPGGTSADAWIDTVMLTEAVSTTPVGHVHLSGSAPTTGTLVASRLGVGGIKDLLLYTSPLLLDGGYQPHVGKSAGVSLLTGSVSASTLPPGSYLVMANVPAMSANHNISVEFSMAGQSVSVSSPLLTGARAAGIYPVGIVTLPLADVPRRRTGLLMDFEVTLTSGFARDLWLFHLGDDSALTQVRNPAGSAYVFIQDPVLGDLTPGVFVGNEADMSDAVFPGVDAVPSSDRHRLIPPFQPIYFYGCDSVSVSHRPAFHHFAAEPRAL